MLNLKTKTMKTKHPEQLAKEYFPEFPTKLRKQLLLRVKGMSIEDTKREFISFRKKIDNDKEDQLPLLLNSIATNSLGFEYNEQLKDLIYMDYSNRNISVHAKPFIAGQYKIFRNEHELLIKSQSENIGEIIKRLDETITLMIELGVLGMLDFREHLEAIKKDPKSINGIVKKVLKHAK